MTLDGRPPKELGTIIAEREYFLEPERKVVIRLGMPVFADQGYGESWCPYQIEGIGSGKVRQVAGIDAFQSIWLAMQTIGAELYSSDAAKTGELRLDEHSTGGDLCLPVPEDMRDLLPPRPPPRPESL